MDIDPKQQEEILTQVRDSVRRRMPVRVLLVEDDQHDAELTLKTLQDVGVSADWVRSKEDADIYLEANDPSMVFLDLKLGTPDRGLEVLKRLKSTKAETTVVILTGVHQHHELECALALKHDAMAIMKKPLKREQAQFIFGTP